MAMTKEQKKRLISNLAAVIDSDVLTEFETLAILQICSDACEREKADLVEKILTESILVGTDSGSD